MKLLLILGMSLMLFSGCNEDESSIKDDIQNVTNQSVTMEETKKVEDIILGEWLPSSAKGKDGEEIALAWLWGSSIQYGGTLKINEDGTYTEYIGAYAETDPLEGSWEVRDENIVLKSKTGDEKIAKIVDKDTLEINYGDYFGLDEYKDCIVRFGRVKANSEE